MDKEQAVIREQLEETRASLTDKLETLENTLVGTVKDVADSASQAVETVSEAVEGTVESVSESIQESVRAVRGLFDIPGHVRAHPWPMVCGAVAVGFLGAKLMERRRKRRRRPPQRADGVPAYTQHTASGNGAGHLPATAYTPAPPAEPSTAPRAQAKAKSWMDELGGLFGKELGQLKGLALGTALGVIRDTLTRSAPEQLRPRLKEMMDGITAKLGGEPIEEPLVSQTKANGTFCEGERHGERHETEMGRPVGAAQR